MSLVAVFSLLVTIAGAETKKSGALSADEFLIVEVLREDVGSDSVALVDLRHQGRRVHSRLIQKLRPLARYIILDMWYASDSGQVEIDKELRRQLKTTPNITFIAFNDHYQLSRPYLVSAVEEVGHALFQKSECCVKLFPSLQIYDPSDSKNDYFSRQTLRFRHLSTVVLDQLQLPRADRVFTLPVSKLFSIKHRRPGQLTTSDYRQKICIVINRFEKDSDRHSIAGRTYSGSEILANMILWQSWLPAR